MHCILVSNAGAHQIRLEIYFFNKNAAYNLRKVKATKWIFFFKLRQINTEKFTKFQTFLVKKWIFMAWSVGDGAGIIKHL
jgi:hypothetical protein